jgi:truncated hemoglobin YjbI
MRHMSEAVRTAGLEPDDETALMEYLEMAARSLINSS